MIKSDTLFSYKNPVLYRIYKEARDADCGSDLLLKNRISYRIVGVWN